MKAEKNKTLPWWQ